ncbi:TraB/GumN family protein [Sphingomonas sabuli]|uniref:TraB/GumN family protein n=1 Tax=Sphingomonas sabuli TaxID=2764186 RepID=A0A7G9L2M6_9SPHN|nr:TraB/GumN family protein [Sphingomonas sabuli]QNM82875.1 TraB/GumN family protein [Sphingomonas sabuli]
MLATFKRYLAPLAALFAVPAAVSAAPAPASVETAKPALWEVSDPDTTIYLFGTIHLLPENYAWRTKAIDTAISRSESLVVETIVDDKNPKELIEAMTRLGYSPGQLPLAERVPAEKRQMLETAIAKTGIPRPIFDKMETWVAAFSLLGVQFADIGVKGQHGVEQTLRDAFGTAGKTIGQLETNAEQLSFFDTLPEQAQRELLEGAIEAPEKMGADFTAMLRSWARGDVDAIAKTFNSELGSSPAIRDALLVRRNANWSQWVEQRLAKPGTVLVAVGAGHLAGPDSVQDLLQREGYKVRRLQ